MVLRFQVLPGLPGGNRDGPSAASTSLDTPDVPHDAANDPVVA